MASYTLNFPLTESEYLLITYLLKKRIEELEVKEYSIINRHCISSTKRLEKKVNKVGWDTFGEPISDKVKEMIEYLEEVAKNKTEK